ncbi:uncharacterized protein C3orf20-like isoform X2 [Micropterus dolomieu]|uniref:uncharacterized protein C3orf20-like isoform X2 n=1 Tax=Micropterus dolomieu TaxID=147949 RepID=UPI001E8EDC07|nr:uncharacterized protein C3orf20-like isoform X2 [Micropterus dolomieu]
MFKETMSSSGALTEFTTGPLYFFDQPTKRIKGTRKNILYLNEANERAQLEDTTQSRDNENKEDKGDELTQRLSGETRGDGKPDTSSAVGAALNVKDRDPMDAYKQAAPPLLNELARLLSQHQWKAEGCIPHGIVNILNYSWKDLTAGEAEYSQRAEQTDKRKSKGSLKLDQARSRQVSGNDKREAGERNSCVVENVGPSVGRPQVSLNPRKKKRKQKSSRAPSSTTISFSMSSNICKNPGWFTQPMQPSCDDPQLISLCQWVVERLQAARNPEKLQTAEEVPKKTLIIRHYGDAKARLKDRDAGTKAQLATLVNGIPRIPKVKQQDPAQQKLHYRINDGSSCIYYPSGCMAVCQSYSGLPCGGFYTTVFSDSECPVILATITAFGHGVATHPLSSAITAVWDQDGGFKCDHHGNINKEWIWQTGRTHREKIVIQLSDLISVRLLSGTSATLTFRCNNERVQLPLSVLFNMNQTKETLCLQTEGQFASDAAQGLLLTRKTKSPSVFQESKRNLTLTPLRDFLSPYDASVNVLQMVREVQELPEQWRRGGHIGRELKRLQQRARNTLDNWLDYYRVAIGIKCPDIERMPDAPPRTRLRREVQSATLPSLNPPERADAKPVQPEEGRNELQELHRHLSAPAERMLDSYIKMPRTPKKRTKEETHVTQIGPLQIHGNIKLESVIIPNSPDLQPSAVIRYPALPSFTPSNPLTVCPPLLRAALLGEGGRRRCCCSATLMPVVTDLEYDAFIMGQPPHSQQILVVCVTLLCQPIHTQAVPDQDVLEQLYRRRNRHRTMPCTQCQMDSFRLVRYEMSTGKHSCGMENILLQQRHNAAPGMVLMYIRGKLLFVGYIFRGHSCSVRDLQKQISRSRGDYRLGLSLPSDYMFSDQVNTLAATFAHNSQDATLKRGDDIRLTASVETEMANERKKNQVPEISHRRQRDICIKPKKD